ncbi:MAG TPA: ATP synthase F0 subunit A [Planctomycetes bacterium]|jgi:F-type H+-transporting ATPase subunit a|nr:ATP synthase F0 subunit A [Planctomycetota bacterium]
MTSGFNLLAASNPMDHISDARLFDGLVSKGTWLYDISGHLYGLGITKQVALFFIAGLLTVLFFWSYVRQIKRAPDAVPGRWGNFVETILDTLRDQLVLPFMGESGLKFLPILATFFVYILICNLIGLIPMLDWAGHGGNTSTANPYITVALAVCAFVLYHGLGLREQGNIFTYIKNLFPHVPVVILPLIIVIEIAAHIIRPCALAIRLCANMVAGHVMVAVLLGFTATLTAETLISGGLISIVSVAAVTALTFLELLVALIQAFVFTFLTTVFLSMAVHPEH